MKKVCLCICAVTALVSHAYAADEQVCALYSGFAKTAMEQRQAGMVVTDLLSAIGNKDDMDKELRRIAIDAYKEPKFSGREFQKKSITEYQNQVFVACMSK